jgi:hypothetical protein
LPRAQWIPRRSNGERMLTGPFNAAMMGCSISTRSIMIFLHLAGPTPKQAARFLPRTPPRNDARSALVAKQHRQQASAIGWRDELAKYALEYLEILSIYGHGLAVGCPCVHLAPQAMAMSKSCMFFSATISVSVRIAQIARVTDIARASR